jgi:hypothetical protein
MPLPREEVDASTPKFLRDKYAVVGVGETTYTRSNTATCSMKIMMPRKRSENTAHTQPPLMSQNNTGRVRLIPTDRAGRRI